MSRVIGCTIGCIPPRINEDVVERLGTQCLAEIGLREGYQQIQGGESVIRGITLEDSGRLLIIPIGTYPPIIL